MCFLHYTVKEYTVRYGVPLSVPFSSVYAQSTQRPKQTFRKSGDSVWCCLLASPCVNMKYWKASTQGQFEFNLLHIKLLIWCKFHLWCFDIDKSNQNVTIIPMRCALAETLIVSLRSVYTESLKGADITQCAFL